MRRGRVPADDRARAGPRRGARALPLPAAARRGGLRLDAERADPRARGRREVGQPVARQGVPRRGVPGAVRGALRRGRAAWAVPRAQAAPPRTRHPPRALGRRPRAPRDHQALLRPLHAGDLGPRLRAAPDRARPGAGLRRRLPAMSGRLSIVLHTHMPYVEGFDTWPFGEEWLWEAVATSYLPVLDVLDRTGAPITLSVTPVLCDQLEAPGALDRCRAFLETVRPESHRIDLEEQPAELHPVIERSAPDYVQAAERLQGVALLAPFAPRAAWTSAATHAVLPLLASDAGARLQIAIGVDSHRRRFSEVREWGGGFWLPECGHAGWLDALLEGEGVYATCVDLTDVFGYGSRKHLRPLCTEAGVTLVPLDRQTIELVWSDHGYPAEGGYRDYHNRTRMDHRPWAVDGTPYDSERAQALVAEHAIDFVARALVRSNQVDDGLVVCALDTELLGHWWYDGPPWL